MKLACHPSTAVHPETTTDPATLRWVVSGITLPFVSYGGSSVVANFALLALLLLVSNRANAQGRA